MGSLLHPLEDEAAMVSSERRVWLWHAPLRRRVGGAVSTPFGQPSASACWARRTTRGRRFQTTLRHDCWIWSRQRRSSFSSMASLDHGLCMTSLIAIAGAQLSLHADPTAHLPEVVGQPLDREALLPEHCAFWGVFGQERRGS